jgi:hypothetical protein
MVSWNCNAQVYSIEYIRFGTTYYGDHCIGSYPLQIGYGEYSYDTDASGQYIPYIRNPKPGDTEHRKTQIILWRDFIFRSHASAIILAGGYCEFVGRFGIGRFWTEAIETKTILPIDIHRSLDMERSLPMPDCHSFIFCRNFNAHCIKIGDFPFFPGSPPCYFTA